jgi:hypothetical protein
MSSAGPSNEDLEMYFKTSRQYFDELANYYKTADPAYYNRFIAPFYTNPLYSASRKSTGSSRAIIAFAAIFFLVIGLGAAGLLIFLSADSDTDKEQDTPKIEKKIGKEIDTPKIDTVKTDPTIKPPKNTYRKQRTR